MLKLMKALDQLVPFTFEAGNGIVWENIWQNNTIISEAIRLSHGADTAPAGVCNAPKLKRNIQRRK